MLIFLGALAVFTLAAWIAVVLLLIHASSQMPHLDEAGKPRADDPPLPRVSVIVTARNEERNAEQALRLLLSLDYPDYEVVFVNDRSDDRTGDIVGRLSAEDDRVVPLHVSELPAGWFGKNHAAYRGAKAATGKLLLFTDADVFLEPKALEFGVRHLLRQKLDHLCATPRLQVSTTGLRACMVAFFFLFVAMRPWKVRDPESTAYFGIGAYNLMKTDAYHAIGGHRRIALRPDDDVQLGRLVKMSGLRSDVLRGTRLVSLAWYASVREFIRGGEKNAFANTGYRISIVAGTTAALLWLTVFPFVLTPVLALLPVPGVWPSATMFAVAAGLCWTVSIRAARAAWYPWWCGLLSPLGTLVVIYTIWRSMLVTMSRGVAWGGPPIPLSVLRGNPVRPASGDENDRALG